MLVWNHAAAFLFVLALGAVAPLGVNEVLGVKLDPKDPKGCPEPSRTFLFECRNSYIEQAAGECKGP